MVVPLEHVIALSMIIFSIGVLGVLIRRNAIVDGQVFVFLVMTLAAAEVAVGLAIIIALYRNRQPVNIDEINLMKY